MYYSYNEYLQALLFTQAEEIDGKRIKDLIDTDLASNYKAEMVKGENYYNGRHDILDHKKTYWVEDVEYEYKNKTNFKITNVFHRKIVKQKVTEIAAKTPSISVEKPTIADPNNITSQEQSLIDFSKDMQQTITKYLKKKFHRSLKNIIKLGSNCGWSAVFFYLSENKKEPGKPLLNYTVIPTVQLIPIFNDNDELQFMIRYYQKQHVNEDTGKMETIYKAEVWNDQYVWYYEQVEKDGQFQRDQSSGYNLITDENGDTLNYAGHWFTYSLSNPDLKEWHSWGRVPFVIFPNDSEMNNDLMPIKTLIDSYDLVDSGWLNDLEDFNKIVHVLRDYMDLNAQQRQEGYNAYAELVHNIAMHGIITLEGTGDYESVKNEIPYEAKRAFLEDKRKAIFYMGSGVNKMDTDKLGNDPSGVSKEHNESELTQKAEDTIVELKSSLTDFIWFVCEYFNRFEGKKYDPELVDFTFNTTKRVNELQQVQVLTQQITSGIISKQSAREQSPNIEDAEEEAKRIEAEDEKDFAKQRERGQDPASLAAMKNNFNNNGNNQ